MGIGRNLLNWYARLSPARGKISPPYEHVVQVGDPRLRKVSDLIPVDKIKTEEIQSVVRKLELVINKYSSVGMSAPQIGINMRIFAMKHSALQILEEGESSIKFKGMVVVPFTVYINPTLKVIDYRKIIHTEGCESIRSFCADVPRYREVEVSGYNQHAEPITKRYVDWPARIAQHEIDHLDGKLYIDIMDKKTFTCMCWEEVNLSKGRVAIPFSPE